MFAAAPCSLILIVFCRLKKYFDVEFMFEFACFKSRATKRLLRKSCSSNCSTKMYVKQFLVKLLYVYNSPNDDLLSILEENTSTS